ncbi:MAG: class A beta-lactamase-related serine hydrolase [Ignavibacteria bacterium]|nr:class A beta-lactamase-related serine hydrolase [Ignavibacteria bacterium]
MKKIAFIFFLNLIFINEAYLQQNFNNSKLELLKKNIENEIAAVSGIFALAFREVGNPDNQLMINSSEVFHAASTMKTSVMVEVFRQAEEGKFSLDDSLVVKNEFKSIVDGSTFSLDVKDDGDDKIYSLIGSKRKIYDLVFDMITVSSNLATNLLIELVGAENVTNTMKNFGLNGIKVLRGVEDTKAFQLNLNNTVTAIDLLMLYELIATKRIISEKSCDEMIKILSNQKFREKIPRFLPDNIQVAHKTGSITGVEHDSGIVFLPDGRKYVLVILSKNLINSENGKIAIGKISKHIYDYMTS